MMIGTAVLNAQSVEPSVGMVDPSIDKTHAFGEDNIDQISFNFELHTSAVFHCLITNSSIEDHIHGA